MYKRYPIQVQKTLIAYVVGLAFVFTVDGLVDYLAFDATPTLILSLMPDAYHEVFMRLLVGFVSVTLVLSFFWFTQKERRSRRYEAHLYHIAPVGIFQSDSQGQLTYVNSKWSQIVGQPDTESIGSGWLSSVYPDDQAEVGRLWETAMSLQRPFRAEFRLRKPTGLPYWVRCEAEPHFDGKVQVGYLGFLSDIHELKSKEQSLEVTTAKLQSALTVKNDFLQIMEHEFHTPINGIFGAVQILQTMEIPAEQKEFFSILERSTLSLNKVFSDIISYQRLRDNRVQPEWEEVRPESMVNDLLNVYQPIAEQKHVALEFERPSDLQPIQTDSVLLNLVLTNLLSNAVKFTEQGKILVKISDWAQNNQFFTRFQVQDTGIGIDQSKAKDITAPFYQVDQSISRSYEGIGLGLSIVEHSLKSLGSSLTISGAVGKGTLCSFDIPHMKPAA